MKRWMVAAVVALGLVGCSRRHQVTRDAEKTAEDLRRHVRYLRIDTKPPQLTDKNPAAGFILTLSPVPSTQEFLFDLKEYWIDRGEGDPSREPTRNLCDVIDSLDATDTPALARYFSEAEVHAGINLGIFDLGLSLKVQLAEALRALGKFVDIKNSHALIVIRGYADGQHGPWTETLNPEYPYHYIRVLNPPPRSRRSSTYLAHDSVVTIQDQYDNKRLPDLRAEFVRQELVLPYLQDCHGNIQAEVRILRGHQYSKPDHPEDRKVQIFVYIIPDE